MDMITVEKRDFAVKAKKLRRLGLVPGSVFGGPLREALALQLEKADARRLVEQKREGSPGGWEYHFTENKKTIPPFKDSLKVREIVKLPCIDQLV